METYFGKMESARMQEAREQLLADLKTLTHDAEHLLEITSRRATGRNGKVHPCRTAGGKKPGLPSRNCRSRLPRSRRPRSQRQKLPSADIPANSTG